MKITRYLIVTILAMVLSLAPACKTTNHQSLQNKAKGIAYLVTAESLLQKPEWRAGFVTASDEFRILSTSTNVTLPMITAIVSKLPSKELRGKHAAIVVTAATLFLEDDIGEAVITQPEELRRAAAGIHAGIDLALSLQ